MADPKAFIAKYLPYAQQFSQKTGIPASWVLAMAANETGFNLNNPVLFGIKGPSPSGNTVNSRTWEQGASGPYNTNANFATYSDPQEAFDHLARQSLIQNAPKTSIGDFISFLKAHNWATDPAYIQKILSLNNQIAPMIGSDDQPPDDGSTDPNVDPNADAGQPDVGSDITPAPVGGLPRFATDPADQNGENQKPPTPPIPPFLPTGNPDEGKGIIPRTGPNGDPLPVFDPRFDASNTLGQHGDINTLLSKGQNALSGVDTGSSDFFLPFTGANADPQRAADNLMHSLGLSTTIGSPVTSYLKSNVGRNADAYKLRNILNGVTPTDLNTGMGNEFLGNMTAGRSGPTDTDALLKGLVDLINKRAGGGLVNQDQGNYLDSLTNPLDRGKEVASLVSSLTGQHAYGGQRGMDQSIQGRYGDYQNYSAKDPNKSFLQFVLGY